MNDNPDLVKRINEMENNYTFLKENITGKLNTIDAKISRLTYPETCVRHKKDIQFNRFLFLILFLILLSLISGDFNLIGKFL